MFYRLTRPREPVVMGVAALALTLFMSSRCCAQLPSFPGAVGQGALATGGRGGDVYQVTNLLDYADGQLAIPGSLRYGVDSASGPRTIVFEVGGALPLARPLLIDKSNLTLAGQSSPTGVTVVGYQTQVLGAENVIVRHLRFRTGDFNIWATNPDGTLIDPPIRNEALAIPGGADALAVGFSNRVILDHLSTSWGLDETLSVTLSKNVTVQHSIISSSLANNEFNGQPGYGSLVRGEVTPEEQADGEGGYTLTLSPHQ